MELLPDQETPLCHRYSHDNLHIALPTRFEPPQAEALTRLLRCNQARCKRIFIDARQVTALHPEAVSALKSSLRADGLATDRVVFKGRQGFTLGVDGNRVLIQKTAGRDSYHEFDKHNTKGQHEHVCHGRCAHCACGRHAGRGEERATA